MSVKKACSQPVRDDTLTLRVSFDDAQHNHLKSLPIDHELTLWATSGALAIGVDEVGRGCLAGPVVAGAVLFDWSKVDEINSLAQRFIIRDSKTLSRDRRRDAAAAIRSVALAVGIAEIDAGVIDEINILQATLRAMREAVEQISTSPHPLLTKEGAFGGEALEEVHVLVDGNQRIPNLSMEQSTIIGGDNKIFSIAAASIIAKEYRDTLMEEFDKEFPGYDFASHKGYGTQKHCDAIRAIGLSPIHRTTFWHG